MEIKDLVPIVWNSQRVLTTTQIADFYGCETRNISDNFKKNESRFKEGVHYFKLVGEPLKNFKSLSDESGLPINKFAPVIYLWTSRGCARHAKMLSTDRAWEVFEELEDNYFNPLHSVPTAPSVASAKVKNPNRVAGQNTPAGLYAAKIGGKVKIGHCHDMEQRLPQIKGSKETPYYQTALFPRKVARLLEKVCHKIFAPYALGNELFDIEYDEACRIIRALEQFAIGLTKVATFGRNDKVLAIAERLLVKASNIIADKSS